MTTCDHEFHWFLESCNEAGWKCVRCDEKPGEPPGFSPEFDRTRVRDKVGGILYDLSDRDFLHVSNGSEGEWIANQVALRCVKANVYDQYSIMLFILELVTPSHQKFWADTSNGIVAGRDPRHRCKCGNLSTGSMHSAGNSVYFCNECWTAEEIFK